MTKDKAIAELIRIWHSPHLDLSLKAGLGEAIEALKGADGDLISRRDAVKPFCITPDGTRIPEVDCDNFPVEFSVEFIKKHLLSLPSAEPKTETVLCALADRECPFQGKEYAWCLTCPYISEEDRALVKKAITEPKTGTWTRSHTGIIGEGFYCSRCGKPGYKTDFCPNCGARMLGGEKSE